MKVSKLKKRLDVRVIDLFCGIGGLTHGFVSEGFNVVAGIDIDDSCRYGFEKNNKSKFIHKDISEVTSEEIKVLFGKRTLKILIGCAPCQPFSALNLKRSIYKKSDRKWESLGKFIELINDIRPEVISMENVGDLANGKKYPIFKKFLKSLRDNDYKIFYRIVDASRYGVPQKRKRLVLLASRLGNISLIPETHNKDNLVTVRDVISRLRPIKDGQTDKADVLHRSSELSEMNKKRIIATPKDGGSANSWDDELVLECHKKKSGHTYRSSVYGRMKWDEPAPTMTTHCVSLGTGRYGHPSQNRAISLREAAIFQTFPDYYEFAEPQKISMTKTAKHVGNAVPVMLGQVIAQSIKEHLKTN